MKENIIVKLSERDHVLLRPNQYIGSVDPVTSDMWIIEDEKIERKPLTFIPGLIKIQNEILDNSVDEAIRCNYQFANKIDVTITATKVTILDNGRGIPVVKVAGTDRYGPDIAFCEARAGANFNDDDGRETIGLNGVGSFATNCWSKKFHAETADGKNKFVLKCKDNAGHAEHVITKSDKQYTEVSFEPDLERFHLTEIDRVHIQIMRQRVLFLSISHPEIKFKFNGEYIKLKSGKDLVSKFAANYEIIENDKYFIALTANPFDEFSFFTYVNGLYVKNGGNHIDLIVNEIVSRLREKLSRKYPNIKPGDIKSKLQIITFLNKFPNARFDSQTKETLTNSVTNIKEYLELSSEDWDKLVAKIMRNTELLDSITEMYKIKEELQKRKDLEDMNKPKKAINIEDYLPPTKEQKYLVISEGLSAQGLIMRILSRAQFGYMAIRGKFINTFDVPTAKLTANEELKNLVTILGMNLTDPMSDMTYENVLIATDADLDGTQIRALLLTFFQKYSPEMVRQGRIKILSTPMAVAIKGGEITNFFKNFEEYNTFADSNKGYTYKYYKGLGSWKGPSDLGKLIEKHGIESFIDEFEMDQGGEISIKEWMSGKESDTRKGHLRGKAFEVFKL
jgi:DNA topoisomerase-2